MKLQDQFDQSMNFYSVATEAWLSFLEDRLRNWPLQAVDSFALSKPRRGKKRHLQASEPFAK